MEPVALYITLMLAGFVMIGMEIFIPGGILGIFGSIAWISAAVIGWRSFPEPWNAVSAFALLIMGILTFVIWIRYFPKTWVGRNLSLQDNSSTYKSHNTVELPAGTVGKALSTLRPSGIASFDGKRLDVVADGEWIEAGESVKISSTSGGHVTVVKA